MKTLLDFLFVRNKHTCPWYCCFTFDNIFRKFFQNPEKILHGFLGPGFNILDIGPGRGYFSIPMAKMVGPQGRIFALDIQNKMLETLKKRALKENVNNRIICKLISGTDFKLKTEIDFALAFWMVHEVPNKKDLLESIHACLKTNGKLLITEPHLHVSGKMIEATRKFSEEIGFKLIGQPKIFFSKTLLLEKRQSS